MQASSGALTASGKSNAAGTLSIRGCPMRGITNKLGLNFLQISAVFETFAVLFGCSVPTHRSPARLTRAASTNAQTTGL